MKSKSDQLPLCGSIVDGLTVLSVVHNQSSIGSSLDEYEILEGIRELSMDLFSYEPSYSILTRKKVEDLVSKISRSKEISPLIVVEDSKGFYILEGSHRFDALNEMKISKFPALVVKDLSSLKENT